MTDRADARKAARHSISDWLALHELDRASCSRILDWIARQPAGEPTAHAPADPAYDAPDLDAAWLTTVSAMRDFWPARQSLIDDTFDHSEKIVVDRRDESRKALTLDNGPTAYPTILMSYRGDPADLLIMAHEFGHALQIRASEGKFVPPIMREVCAFVGEDALLSHALKRNAAQHGYLAKAWRRDSRRYFGVQRDRLSAALSTPDAPYRYAWNYPIARYLAIRIADRCPRDWIWSVFAGKISVQDALRALA